MTMGYSKRGRTCTPKLKKVDQLSILWDLLPHPRGSVVRLFSRSGESRTGDFARNLAEMRKYVRQHEGKNVYVALNPTGLTTGMRHSAEDVTHWSFFPIDMDPVEKGADPERALDEALLWFGEWNGIDFRGTPPIIVDSGRGLQAWIRLNDTPLVEGDLVIGGFGLSRQTARRVNGYWLRKLDEKLKVCHGCRVDTSVSDLPRVMRCPGTVNEKTGRETRFVCTSPNIFLDLTARIMAVPKSALVDPPSVATVKVGTKWQKVFHLLTRTAQTYLTLGQEEPGRHKAMWCTAKKLQEIGIERAEARRALSRANKLQGSDQALPDDQIDAALKSAYGVNSMEVG